MLDKGFPLNETTLSHAVDGAVLTIRSYEKMPDVDRQLKVIQHLLDRAKERNVSCDLSYFLSLPTNFKTVKFFVEHGADINRSPKQNPISSALDEVDTDDGYNTIKYLIQKGANVNAHEFNGNVSATLLQCAIKRGRIDVIQLLVDHGANLEMEGGKNVSPLQSAIESGSRTVVEYLLKRGAKTDHGTSDGYAPLAYATTCGWVQDVKLLLKYGADKSAKGSNGKTAYDVAKANNDKVMMGLLK
jgi:ankyrin repeat protein